MCMVFFRISVVDNSFDCCHWWPSNGSLYVMFDQVSSMVSNFVGICLLILNSLKNTEKGGTTLTKWKSVFTFKSILFNLRK